MQILALQEENRQLKRQVRHLTEVAESSERNIFTANADGDIVEMQRSRNARRWRRDIRTERRALPSFYSSAAYEHSVDGNAKGAADR